MCISKNNNAGQDSRSKFANMKVAYTKYVNNQNAKICIQCFKTQRREGNLKNPLKNIRMSVISSVIGLYHSFIYLQISPPNQTKYIKLALKPANEKKPQFLNLK